MKTVETTEITKTTKPTENRETSAGAVGDETPQTITKSAETGKVPDANELKDHMGKYKTKVLEPPTDTRQKQRAPKGELS